MQMRQNFIPASAPAPLPRPRVRYPLARTPNIQKCIKFLHTSAASHFARPPEKTRTRSGRNGGNDYRLRRRAHLACRRGVSSFFHLTAAARKPREPRRVCLSRRTVTEDGQSGGIAPLGRTHKNCPTMPR